MEPAGKAGHPEPGLEAALAGRGGCLFGCTRGTGRGEERPRGQAVLELALFLHEGAPEFWRLEPERVRGPSRPPLPAQAWRILWAMPGGQKHGFLGRAAVA